MFEQSKILIAIAALFGRHHSIYKNARPLKTLDKGWYHQQGVTNLVAALALRRDSECTPPAIHTLRESSL